jgi:hypothetical protein
VEESRYRIDGTRLYIDLERPLLPGRKIDIGLDFEILIPEMIAHFGYDSDGAYLIAHCFPILCGFQKDRLIDWEYHANSEFFSNFSFYNATIELPVEFKAVSTGGMARESENDSSAVWRAHADTVIDFALACGPGLKEFESEIDGIKLRYLLKEKHADLFPVADSAMKNSLQFCGDLLFPYPYAQFALADVGFTNAGLELPGLIVAGIFGSGGKMKEIFLKKTVAHEAAHQWFYAAVATNEFEEPWLDEGFASFLEFKIAREYGFDTFPLIFSIAGGWAEISHQPEKLGLSRQAFVYCGALRQGLDGPAGAAEFAGRFHLRGSAKIVCGKLPIQTSRRGGFLREHVSVLVC